MRELLDQDQCWELVDHLVPLELILRQVYFGLMSTFLDYQRRLPIQRVGLRSFLVCSSHGGCFIYSLSACDASSHAWSMSTCLALMGPCSHAFSSSSSASETVPSSPVEMRSHRCAPCVQYSHLPDLRYCSRSLKRLSSVCKLFPS